MLAFLLPLASKIVDAALAKLPNDEELGEKLVEICLHILEKAVALTKSIDQTRSQITALVRGGARRLAGPHGNAT